MVMGARWPLPAPYFIVSTSSAPSCFIHAPRVAGQILFDKWCSVLEKKVCKPQVQRTDF